MAAACSLEHNPPANCREQLRRVKGYSERAARCMRDTPMSDRKPHGLSEQSPWRQSNLNTTMIGCVAFPIIGYGIIRLLVHLLG